MTAGGRVTKTLNQKLGNCEPETQAQQFLIHARLFEIFCVNRDEQRECVRSNEVLAGVRAATRAATSDIADEVTKP